MPTADGPSAKQPIDGLEDLIDGHRFANLGSKLRQAHKIVGNLALLLVRQAVLNQSTRMRMVAGCPNRT